MLNQIQKPYMKLEFVNQFSDRVVVEFENTGYDGTEAAWMVQNFRQFMLAVGFHPNTVNEYLPEE
jgi:hypothetical protein